MKTNIDAIAVGDRVRHIRENIVRLKQKEFADLVGLGSECTVSRIENGTQAMDVFALRRIVSASGVTADWLLSGDGTKPRVSTCSIEDSIVLDNGWLEARYGINSEDIELVSCSSGTCIPVINRRDIAIVNKKNNNLSEEGYYVMVSDGQKIIRKVLPTHGGNVRIYVGSTENSYYDSSVSNIKDNCQVIGKVIMVVKQI